MKVFIFFVIFVSIAVVVAKPIESELDGLYGSNDNVTVLTGETFRQTIFKSPHIWMVEFYASWCGHCQEYAPIFKAFAKDIADWHAVYQLAVINCPDKPNVDLCSTMNVKGYPELRVFLPYSTSESEYKSIKANTLVQLRNASRVLIAEHIDEIGWSLPGVSKPTFFPISYEEVRTYHKNAGNSFYLAVVVGDDPFNIGQEVILDTSSCRNITVRIFDSDPAAIKKLQKHVGVTLGDFPTVIVLSEDGTSREVNVDFKRRHFYTYKLQRLPGVGNPVSIPSVDTSASHKRKSTYVDWRKVDRRRSIAIAVCSTLLRTVCALVQIISSCLVHKNSFELMIANHGVGNASILLVAGAQSKVYVADLESGIRYALAIEVTPSVSLEGESLDALNTFVGTLALVSEQLPVSETTKNFLVRLTGWLAGQSEINRRDWLKQIQSKEDASYLPELDQKWVGCAPSKANLRGYPCSLWTLFHAMTVAAHNSDTEDAMAVPRAMEAYVTSFFSCLECRENFYKELMRNPYEDRISTNRDAILWLWALHNEVNKRLHGAESEDPNIPKVQYPPVELCQTCRYEDGEWDEKKVARYLVQLYSANSVSEDFTAIETRKKNSQRQGDSDVDLDRIRDLLENPVKIEDRLIVAFDEDQGGENGADEFDVQGNPKIKLEAFQNRRKQQSFHYIKHVADERLSKLVEDRLEQQQRADGLSSFETNLCYVLWVSSLTLVIMMYLYLKKCKIYKKC